jgi:protein-tyrosine phosphatase
VTIDPVRTEHAPALTSLLFVCLGNICRSPLAEAVMRSLLAERGLSSLILCDSAGTGGWHVGDLPDHRARAEARRHGLELTHRGQQVRRVEDLAPFDLVLAMDHANLADLRRIAPLRFLAGDIRLLREYDPGATSDEVPDPYYGDADDFAAVFEVCESACAGLLDQLLADRALDPGG